MWETFQDGKTQRVGELSAGWGEELVLIAGSPQAAQVVKESIDLPSARSASVPERASALLICFHDSVARASAVRILSLVSFVDTLRSRPSSRALIRHSAS